MTRLSVPITAPVTKIYNPGVAGSPHAVINNNGPVAVYLGGDGVTPTGGMWFPPGATISFPYAPYAIYACDNSITTGTPSTTLSNAYSAGAGTVVVSSGTGLVAGESIAIVAAASSGTEIITISTISGGTIVTVNPTLYDHQSGATVATITAQAGGSLYVDMGAT